MHAQLSSAPLQLTSMANLISVYCVRKMRRWILVYHNHSHTHYTHIGRCNALLRYALLCYVLFVCKSIIMNNKRKSSHPFLVETDGKFIVMSAKIPKITLRAKTINIFSMRTQSDRAVCGIGMRRLSSWIFQTDINNNIVIIVLLCVYSTCMMIFGAVQRHGSFECSGRGVHVYFVCACTRIVADS